MAKKIKKIQVVRHLVQLILFFLLPGLYIMAFSELKSIYKMILKGDFNFMQALTSSVELISVTIATIVLGRFFCGWMCAFGAYNDFIHEISKNIFKVKYRVNEKVDSVLKYLKYIVLAVIVALSWTMGSTVFTSVSPWDAFAQITDLPQIITGLALGLILLVLITIGAFYIERFFCRYLCPLGALFNIFSKLSIFKINMPKDKCGNCRACTSQCSMGIPLYKKDKAQGGECINCLKCVEICPRKNAKANILDVNVNSALASSVAVAACVGLYSINGLGAINNNGIASSANISTNSNTNSASQKYKDGTYTGTGIGFRGGTTEVSVTIKNGKIADIETISDEDTPRFYGRTEGTMFDEIMSSQSTDVDVVSGATFSSRGIISAVQDALNKAEDNAADTNTNSNTTADNNSDQNDDRQGTASAASSTSGTNGTISSNNAQSGTNTTKSTTQIQNNSTTNNTSATSSSYTTNSSTTTSTNSSSNTSSNTVQKSKYKNGTYTGTGNGFRGGTTVVSVTISNGKITSINTLSTQDTPRFYQRAVNAVPDEIVSAQSASVDVVTGATFSSNGIIQAVANALSKAV